MLVEPSGCSSMVEHQLPKLNTGFRLPSPALLKTGRLGRFFAATVRILGCKQPCRWLRTVVRIHRPGPGKCGPNVANRWVRLVVCGPVERMELRPLLAFLVQIKGEYGLVVVY